MGAGAVSRATECSLACVGEREAMHMLIYALVDAPDRDSALAAGRLVFDRLVGRDPTASAVFDYYVTLRGVRLLRERFGFDLRIYVPESGTDRRNGDAYEQTPT